MMKYLVGTVSLLISALFYWLVYITLRGHILEIGYRTKRKFKRNRNVPYWKHYLLVDICICAKVNKRTVWYFFAEFIVLCICVIISITMWIFSFAFSSASDVFTIQAGFGLTVLVILSVFDGVLAQQYVPSAQRRRRPIPKFTKEK